MILIDFNIIYSNYTYLQLSNFALKAKNNFIKFRDYSEKVKC